MGYIPQWKVYLKQTNKQKNPFKIAQEKTIKEEKGIVKSGP